MKQIIETSSAPKPIGPYSQAVLSGNTLFVSGQIPVNPENGLLIQGDIQAETKCVMNNLKGILNEANMNFDNVLKCTIFLKDMDDFGQINDVYGSYFDPASAPARETVQVARLPKDVNLEISCIAVK